MTINENFNTMHARIVCLTDDDNDDACHAFTTFNHASNANNITDTSIVVDNFRMNTSMVDMVLLIIWLL
jgi:hypothetical protein